MKISKNILLTGIKLGAYELRNRVVMCPLTRSRTGSDGVPTYLHVQYYSDRAENAGFIRTECTAVSSLGNCFVGAPGIYTEKQIMGWSSVCEAVHKVQGIIFLQIWHCGRAGVNKIIGGQPICPSAVRNRHPARTPEGYTEFEEPKEMSENDIEEVLEQFRVGAQNALKAGFDGIELHAANGYLIDQFLRDAVNKRTDNYGGSYENRCRFPLQVMDILIDVFGADKVGIKISPVGRVNDMFDSDPIPLFTYFVKELNKRKIAYIEIVRAPEFRPVPNNYDIKGEEQIPNVYETFRNYFDGVLIANNGFDFESGNKIIENGQVDMVGFGRLYIANPDLVQRFENGWPLNKPNDKTFYTPGPEGYIDYPKYKV